MKWNIVTDSSCDLTALSGGSGDVRLSSVPFIINVGKADFVDDARLDTSAMLAAMEKCPEASHTSCPSPQSWLAEFEKADRSIAITISSRLSGSINSALIAREMVLEEHPEKQIAVLDSRSAGPELALCVEEIECCIESGGGFEGVVSHARAFLQKTGVMFALCSFDNLVKNGRMGKIAGFAARKLGMWGIGAGSDEGEIEVTGKARGDSGAVSRLLEHMRAGGFRGGRVAISHCHNPELANRLRELILKTWSGSEIVILPTRGLCSYYAERGGLILAY